jgi:hypothetical protein
LIIRYSVICIVSYKVLNLAFKNKWKRYFSQFNTKDIILCSPRIFQCHLNLLRTVFQGLHFTVLAFVASFEKTGTLFADMSGGTSAIRSAALFGLATTTARCRKFLHGHCAFVIDCTIRGMRIVIETIPRGTLLLLDSSSRSARFFIGG